MIRGLRSLAFVLPMVCLILACGSDGASPTPSDGTMVTVTYVVDGDTVELDDGRRVRYVGINTPERGQPFYLEATEANRRMTEGNSAWMVLDAQSTDRYGRILAYLWVNGRFVNVELVRQGYANAYTEPPNVRYSDEIVSAEKEARQAQRGLWAQADVPIKIQELHYDAPGRDDQNPNGEWVALVNEGSKAIDLSGFTLKDEANHIYTFPSAQLRPGNTVKLFSGQGQNSSSALYWGLVNDAVWSNEGDTAYLRDPQGRLVDDYSY